MSRRRDRASDVLVDAVLLLFLFQLVTEFVAAIYAFGLLGTDIPPEIVSVLLLFSPVLLLLGPRMVRRGPYLGLVVVILLSRIGGVELPTRGRMIVTGVGVAAALVWLPARLWRMGQEDEGQTAQGISVSVAVVVALLMLFRVLGSGLDLTRRESGRVVVWGLAALAAALQILRPPEDVAPSAAEGREVQRRVSLGRLVLRVLGLNSGLILLYFGFTSPNVIARWTGASYPAVVVTMVAGLGLFAAVGALRPALQGRAGAVALTATNVIFVVALALTLRIHQIEFPTDPGAYPLYAPDASPVADVPLYLALLLFPVIFVDVALYAGSIAAPRPSPRALGGAFTVSSLYWLVMIFAHVFTTVYDYIPVVGPAFRDRFWLVYVVAGLGLTLPLLAVRRRAPGWSVPMRWAVVMVALGGLTMAAVFTTGARPGDAAATASVKVATYNIQQGYGETGQRAVDEQMALLRSIDADIIGLQESDTNRIAGGNVDLVRYFADALDMHAYYGPTTVVGTFGIALLSKYPIEAPRTFYMHSLGEQTATIEAAITVGDVSYHVFVTHLGNDGPIVQQEAVLEAVAGRENVILMGDFNFRPGTAQYALTTAMLNDAAARTEPGRTQERQIDHIFVSGDLQVQMWQTIGSPASDHPLVAAVVRR